MSTPARDDRLIGAVVWTAVLGLVAWSAWHRWQVLSATPYPLGIDGYFYATQVRALIEDGSLAYPAAPLTFWLMAPVALVSDPITAVKLVAAVVGALAAVPAFLLGRRVGGRAGGLAAAVLVVTAGGSFYLSLEFVKNGVGLTVALTAVWLVARAADGPKPGRIALAAAALVATALTHKMAAAMAIVLAAPAVIVAARARPWSAATTRWLAVAAAAAVALLVVAGVVAPARFLAARDVALVDDLVTTESAWDLPALLLPRPGDEPVRLGVADQGLIVAAVVLLFAVAAAVAYALRTPREARPTDDAIAWAAFALAALISLPWLAVDDPQGLGFRLRLAAFAPAAIVVAAAVGRATAALALPAALRPLVVVPPLLAWLVLRPAEPALGVPRPHPLMVSAMQALAGRLPADAVVITSERNFGFMAGWYARVHWRLRPDAVPPARRWRLLGGFRIGLGSPLDRALHDARGAPGVAPPIGLHPSHENGLVLVPEATWEWVLARVPPELADYWRRWPTI